MDQGFERQAARHCRGGVRGAAGCGLREGAPASGAAMTDVETILGMIRTVDPADTAKMDEDDARVYCYTGNLVYLNHDKHPVSAEFSDAGPAWSTFTCQRFTRSRDALNPSGLAAGLFSVTTVHLAQT
jgi:hypothetical protein